MRESESTVAGIAERIGNALAGHRGREALTGREGRAARPARAKARASKQSWVPPGELCRLDAALVSRVARGEGLGRLCASALATVVAGTAAYGAAMGAWRAPEQALFAAIKLPLLFVALWLTTIALNAMLAIVLRAPMGLRQSAASILIGLATTALVLGALSPVAAFLSLGVRGPDPRVLGLPLEDPRAAADNAHAQALVLFHAGVVAVAGVLGNLGVYRVLRALLAKRELALRVLFAWLSTLLFAGSELSWIARPFLGRPHTEVAFFVREPFEGGFFGEIASALVDSLGVTRLAGVAIILAVLALSAWALFRPDGRPVELSLASGAVVVTSGDERWTLALTELARLTTREAVVLFAESFELVLDVRAGPSPRLLVRFERESDAEALCARIEAERVRARGPGPFRSSQLA